MLKFEKVNIFYGPIHVIYDLDFHVNEGECVALLGSNGAGKTTILNAISGLTPHTSGDISFEEKILKPNSSGMNYENGIIQVPEGGKTLPFMTVKENLIMGAVCRTEAWKKRQKTMEWVCSIFPILKERFNQEARLLSGGERQMLVVGRGLMALPKLLMIDEPSLGVGPKIILEIFKTMRILREQGLTLLLSEQNVSQALKLASRGYVLEKRPDCDGGNERGTHQ